MELRSGAEGEISPTLSRGEWHSHTFEMFWNVEVERKIFELQLLIFYEEGPDKNL
jgi:hypothetical protein